MHGCPVNGATEWTRLWLINVQLSNYWVETPEKGQLNVLILASIELPSVSLGLEKLLFFITDSTSVVLRKCDQASLSYTEVWGYSHSATSLPPLRLLHLTSVRSRCGLRARCVVGTVAVFHLNFLFVLRRVARVRSTSEIKQEVCALVVIWFPDVSVTSACNPIQRANPLLSLLRTSPGGIRTRTTQKVAAC